jgi:hypothetical protein
LQATGLAKRADFACEVIEGLVKIMASRRQPVGRGWGIEYENEDEGIEHDYEHEGIEYEQEGIE